MTATTTEQDNPLSLKWVLANPILIVGILSIFIPTMLHVARSSWSSEQGGHGPIVLATGLWLLYREWQLARPVPAPPPAIAVGLGFVALLALYVVARISFIYELEGYLMYAVLVWVLYSSLGLKGLKALWFPLIYLVFLFPPPDTLVAVITNPLKIALSKWVVSALYHFGLPIAQSGVVIQIGQYQLLVADACSGLNSLISLSAISLFYVYLRHRAEPLYSFLLFLTVLPVAVFANIIRILFLVLLTYFAGESAAQGFLHSFAGMTTFMSALLGIFMIDSLLGAVWSRRQRRKVA